MAGRGQIPDDVGGWAGRDAIARTLVDGLPTGPGTGLSQQQFGDRFPSQDAFNLGQGQGYSEGQTIQQTAPVQVPGDDWNPYAAYQDAIRYGGGRNSLFGPNLTEQAPETRMADPNLYNIADQYTGDMRDYTGLDPLPKTDSLENNPSVGRGDSQFGFDTATPWWQQYVSPQANQNFSNQYGGWAGRGQAQQPQQQQQSPWGEVQGYGGNVNNYNTDPYSQNDINNIVQNYDPQYSGRGNALGPTQQQPWDTPQQPGGDTNQPQDYQGGGGGTQQPQSQPDPYGPFRTAAPPESYPTVSMPTPTPNQFGTTPTQSYFSELPAFTGNIGPSGYSPSDAAFSGMYQTHATPDRNFDALRARRDENQALNDAAWGRGRGQ